MIDIHETESIINEPNWNPGQMKIVFTFRNGLHKTVIIDTIRLSPDTLQELRQHILGKRKLIQSIFEHKTHGQITVQGMTVRADDLIAVEIS